MLIKSTDKNEKIVLGLLSYTFSDLTPSIEDLKSMIYEYRNDENKEIYLYKDDQKDNYIGLIAIEINSFLDNNDSKNQTINVERLAIIPSFRNEGFGYKMFVCLKELYPEATIIGTMGIVDLITHWTQKYNKEY